MRRRGSYKRRRRLSMLKLLRPIMKRSRMSRKRRGRIVNNRKLFRMLNYKYSKR